MTLPTQPLGFAVTVAAPFENALSAVTDALKQEGFGILNTIDIRATFKEKLGVDFRKYAILGVCNPGLAHQALTADSEAGLLLPCTITVEEIDGGGSLVRIANPEAMLRAGQFDAAAVMRTVATEASARLRRVAEAVGEAARDPTGTGRTGR